MPSGSGRRRYSWRLEPEKLEAKTAIGEVVEDVRELEHILRRAGLREDRLLVKIDEGAAHSEKEWAKRFPEALTFLFGESS